MSDATDFAENEIADWLGANGAPSSVSNVYLKLHTGDPGENATANASAEDLRREATFAAASGGAISLDATVSWGTVDVGGTQTITHVSGWDASTNGNALFKAALASSVVLMDGDNFNLTALTVTVT
jgi:hypothetical protein